MRINLVEAVFQVISLVMLVLVYLLFRTISELGTFGALIGAVIVTGISMYALRRAGRVDA